MSTISTRDRVRASIRITRPVNAVVAGILTFIGAFVGSEAFLSQPAIVAVVATVVATAGGNVINDYFDRDIDRVNAPDRPIPSGKVAPREALWLSVGLFVVAIGLALTLPLPAIVIAAINLIALITYTPYFKGQPGTGNLVIAYLGGSTFLFGGLAVGSAGPALVLAFLAMLSTFSREVVKDVEDLAGDQDAGLTTLPIRIGSRRALWVATIVLLVAILASPLPFLTTGFGVAYLVVVSVADLLFLYAANQSFRDPTSSQQVLKYGMFVAALAFIVGRLTGV